MLNLPCCTPQAGACRKLLPVTWHLAVSAPQELRWVGGWGPQYLVVKRERGPARVPRLRSSCVANRFSDDTQFGQYLFQGCINLAEFTLRELHSSGGNLPQTAASDLALGCLSSTGITMLTLTQGFSVIGAHACDSCHLLKKVDRS